MATNDDDDDERQPCGACNGEGGAWSVPNGDSFKKRRWIVCKFCKGNKYV
jgi:hypothetical protein